MVIFPTTGACSVLNFKARSGLGKLSYRSVHLIAFMLGIATLCSAQNKVANYYAQAGKSSLTSLWHASKIYYVGAPEPWDNFPEPLGFIGSNYQRFYIHYTSVVKDAGNPYRYKVQGKTRVKNNICDFTGTISIRQAKRHLKPNIEYPQFKYGYLICEVDLKEDPKQAGSGTIKGKMITNWYINKQGQFAYDTLEPFDGFSNNECVGRWTPHNGGPSKVCNWGDFRIPESGGLDIGVGEFSVSNKYINNGWQNYMKAMYADDGKPEGKKALAEEKRPWWNAK